LSKNISVGLQGITINDIDQNIKMHKSAIIQHIEDAKCKNV